jgi:pimeloyl-[acyl-carrier protein] methyl ester esterase
MTHATLRGLCATKRARLFMIAGLAIAAAVSAQEARALETIRPAATQVALAAFASDRLTVQVIGEGPDVILIPGLISSREVYRATAERLKGTHRLHLVQLAGFAGEPWIHGDGAFVQPVVDELSRYIRQQGLERPAVIGHSMGALTGLVLAQQHPDQVGKLLSIDSLPFFTAMFSPQATVETARPMAEQMTAMLASTTPEVFAQQQRMSASGMSRNEAAQADIIVWSLASDRQAMAAAMRDVMTTDARPGLAAMTMPVTALYAADADGGAPAAMADAVWSRDYAALPGVKLVRIDGSRHFIMADQPEAFAAQVDAFLKD